MDGDSSGFNETDKQLPPLQKRHSEEKLLHPRAKKLMPDLHLFSLFKPTPDLLHFFVWAARYLYNRMQSFKSLLKRGENIRTQNYSKYLTYRRERSESRMMVEGGFIVVFLFHLIPFWSASFSEYSNLKKAEILVSSWLKMPKLYKAFRTVENCWIVWALIHMRFVRYSNVTGKNEYLEWAPRVWEMIPICPESLQGSKF